MTRRNGRVDVQHVVARAGRQLCACHFFSRAASGFDRRKNMTVNAGTLDRTFRAALSLVSIASFFCSVSRLFNLSTCQRGCHD
jgi:hypothetical protein